MPSPNKASSDTDKNDQGKQTSKSPTTTPEDYKFFGASIPDWLVGLFTFCLVVLGGLQWWAMQEQATYMRHQLKLAAIQTKASLKNALAAKESADAAKTSAIAAQASAETVLRTERAWLVLERFVPNFLQVTFMFTNFGRVPARLVELRHEMILSDKSSVWPIDYSKVCGNITPPIMVPPQQSTNSYLSKLNFNGILTEAQQKQVSEGTLFIHFYGVLRYWDASRQERATPFYYSYQSSGLYGTAGWMYSGPPEANEPT